MVIANMGVAAALAARPGGPMSRRILSLLLLCSPVTALATVPFARSQTVQSEIYAASSPYVAYLAPAGDLNGDGFGDALAADSGQWDTGRLPNGFMPLYGSANGMVARPWVRAEGDIQLIGPVAADVNGDGYSDVAAMLNTTHILIFLGGAAGVSAEPAVQIAAPGVSQIAAIGDADNDGRDELVVQLNSFESFVVGLSESGAIWAPLDLYPCGAICGGLSGGDANGDGYADLFVGSPESYNPWVHAHTGAVFVFFGGPSGIPAQPDQTVWGHSGYENFGSGLFAEDVNGDGFDDIVAENNVSWAGDRATSINYSGPNGYEAGEYQTLTLPSAYYATTLVGDVDGDGAADLVVHEADENWNYGTSYDGWSANCGYYSAYSNYTPARLRVYYGGEGGPSLDNTTTIVGPSLVNNYEFGRHKAVIQNSRGQGLPELIIQSTVFDTTVTDSTATYCWATPQFYALFSFVSTDISVDTPLDTDGDSIPDAQDSCPGITNQGLDIDNDGVDEACDRCLGVDSAGDLDVDFVCDDLDACWGDDGSGDSDGDLVCDDLDLCEGDDGTGDTDGDLVCDNEDACDGDDLQGDGDGDGSCADQDACDGDPSKLVPGACGCGSEDLDADADGVTDCLEEGLRIEGRRSHVYFENGRAKRANFYGSMELSGGLLAPDLRDGSIGLGQIEVLVQGNEAYTSGDLLFATDSGTEASDNLEKWTWKDSNTERATLRWKSSEKYMSTREVGFPAISASNNIGRLVSRFIHADETMLRFRWNGKTQLPLSLAIDGVPLLTVKRDTTDTCEESASGVTPAVVCLDGYSLTSPYDIFEVYRDEEELNRVIDVSFTGDRLGDGNVIAWFADGEVADGLDGLLHSQVAIDDGTDSSVWYNAGGRFDITVPLQGAQPVVPSGSCPNAELRLQLGDSSTRAVAEGAADFYGYAIENGQQTQRKKGVETVTKTWTHWRATEVSEDCQLDDDTCGED